VADDEGVSVEPAALSVIAEKADGGMRDALSIFDQMVSFSNGQVTYQSVITNLNVLDYDYYFGLTDAFLECRISDILLTFNDILNKGFDANGFVTGLSRHFRSLLVSRDPQTLQLLEASDDIRRRYQQQAQRCTPKFIYKAMKLCNDCDINYRQSKNKRLLVELTLIEIAQSAKEDDLPSGLGPTKSLKPIFTKASAPVAQSSSSPVAPVSKSGEPSVAQSYSSSSTTSHASSGSHSDARPSASEKKSSGGFSLKGMRDALIKEKQSSEQSNSQQKEKEEQQAPSPNDRPLNIGELEVKWMSYAKSLPAEEKAFSARIIDLANNLNILDANRFEVLANNPSVEEQLQAYIPQIQSYLRRELGNKTLSMSVRLRKAEEKRRAYSRSEQLEELIKQNPALEKLKDTFKLELS